MEILILIGIFAFAIAILFRSNEALDRVGEVEQEVKAIEGGLVQTEAPVQQAAETVPVSTPEVDTQTETKIEAANPINTPFPPAESVHIY